MGKKFKFKPSSKPKPEAAPQQPAAPQKAKHQFKPQQQPMHRPPAQGPGPGQAPQGEAAAQFQQPESDAGLGGLIDSSAMDEMLQGHLSSIDEAAAKVGENNIEVEDFSSDDFLGLIAEQHGLEIVHLSEYERPAKELLDLLTALQAKQLLALPLKYEEDGSILVAIGDPENTTIADDLQAMWNQRIHAVVADKDDMIEKIDSYYGLGDETMETIVRDSDVVEENVVDDSIKEITLDSGGTEQSPVIRLVDVLLIQALKSRSSDIHIEPFPNVIRIRYRIDGVLREIPSPPFDMLIPLTSRIKVLSGLNISESRLPQDGRLKMIIEGREIDMRISSMPTAHGEAIVIRILDKDMMQIGLNQIGMSDDVLSRFRHHIKKPNGVVMVTGPTGSGKTTTLYAGLGDIKDPGDKLITVEDPVEFEMAGVIQVNINENVGLTFAKCLRAILRQDPDTVFVGEIRDVETAQIAVQAALTGHLVFTTLHTNSAAATITRLIDMGVQPFLITSSLEAVIGQRLVRTICPACKAPYRPQPEELEEFGVTAADVANVTFYQGKGCAECAGTGYRGRLGLFELLEIDDDLRDLILDQASTDEIHEAARRTGMQTMREDGWNKIMQGIATFEEVGRETPRDVNLEAYDAGDGTAIEPGEAPEPATAQPAAAPAQGVPQQAVPQQAVPQQAPQQQAPQQAPQQPAPAAPQTPQPGAAPTVQQQNDAATADILSKIGKAQ